MKQDLLVKKTKGSHRKKKGSEDLRLANFLLVVQKVDDIIATLSTGSIDKIREVMVK